MALTFLILSNHSLFSKAPCSARLGAFGCAPGQAAKSALPRRRLYDDFVQLLIHLQDLNFISQAGPAAKQLGIFLRGSAGLLGVPITKQHVVRTAVVIKKIAAVSVLRDDGVQFANGSERSGLHASQRLPNRNGQEFLGHTPRL